MDTAKLRRPKRAPSLFDSAVRIPLGGKYGRGKFALVDPADADLAARSWCANRDGYAVSASGGTALDRMHRLVLDRMGGRPAGKVEADHLNRDKLDNRRSNLRWATRSQNLRNRRWKVNAGRCRGLARHTYRDGTPFFVPAVSFDGKVFNLGSFPDEETAGRVFDAYASVYYGAFAVLNFPDDEPWSLEECERVRVACLRKPRASVPMHERIDAMLADRGLPPRSPFV